MGGEGYEIFLLFFLITNCTKRYNRNLASYMRAIGTDLTSDMAPPKSLYVEVQTYYYNVYHPITFLWKSGSSEGGSWGGGNSWRRGGFAEGWQSTSPAQVVDINYFDGFDSNCWLIFQIPRHLCEQLIMQGILEHVTSWCCTSRTGFAWLNRQGILVTMWCLVHSQESLLFTKNWVFLK